MDFAGDMTLNQLFVGVRHLHHQRAMALFDGLGLYFGQPPILFELWKKDGLTQTEIAQLRNLSPATVTVALKRMEKAGWISRRPDEKDSRISRVFLTDKGREIQVPVEEKLKQLEDETFKHFDEAEKALMKRLLAQIWNNLKK